MRWTLLLLSIVVLGSPAAAQQVANSALTGKIVSRSGTIPAGDTSIELYAVPERGDFILTQACLGLPVFRAFPLPVAANRIVGSSLGAIPLTAGGCTRFEPGIALVSGETLTCEINATTDAETVCLVTGVLQLQRSHHRD